MRPEFVPNVVPEPAIVVPDPDPKPEITSANSSPWSTLTSDDEPLSDYQTGSDETGSNPPEPEKVADISLPWTAFTIFKANLLFWFPTSTISNEDVVLNFHEEVKKNGGMEKWDEKAKEKNATEKLKID